MLVATVFFVEYAKVMLFTLHSSRDTPKTEKFVPFSQVLSRRRRNFLNLVLAAARQIVTRQGVVIHQEKKTTLYCYISSPFLGRCIITKRVRVIERMQI